MTDEENNRQWRKYFYPGTTDVLINNYGIKDKDKLKEVEATNSFQRLLELQDKPLDLGYGKEHLNEIHKYLFEDVYPFAGQYRIVDIGSFLTINSSKDIGGYLDELFEEIEKELMQCRSKEDFAEILSKLYTQLVYCHPYIEGNGRTLKEFLREFSMGKSMEVLHEKLELDWTKVDKEELNKDIALTARLFEKALISEEKEVSK